VNGTKGVLKYIIYLPKKQQKKNDKIIVGKDMPDYLIIHFDDYTGESCINGLKAVPIKPVEHKFEINQKKCSRTQFPVKLCYA